MTLHCLNSIRDVRAADWDALVPIDQPFLSHAFLLALELSESVGPGTGWQPAHAVLHNDVGQLVAAMPGWQKLHSRGEYVFDQGWAEAAFRAGLGYYPKWLSAVPFSPITGPRLLGAAWAVNDLLMQLPSHSAWAGFSGLHVNFTDSSNDACFASDTRWLHRRDCQYRWNNRGYTDFEAFLAQLTADRRKKIRQERKKLVPLGLKYVWRYGDDCDATLQQRIYACYANTYEVRGQQPYLTPAFFAEIFVTMARAVQVLCVEREGELVAMALYLAGNKTLYGRYWGALDEIPLLHFEACLYQGIERAIAQGFDVFDAGAQGEHKLIRGFEPVLTSSWHLLRHGGLHAAIADFLQRERGEVLRYQQAAQTACPLKAGT
jgi:predicted N-acyltransferase